MALSEAEELELLELERSRHFALAATPMPTQQELQQSPTFLQGLKLGALDQPAPQTEHWYSPASVGHFVGEAALPTAGAIVGSVAPGYGTAVGAAAGEAAKKAIGRGYEAASGKEFKDESAARTITDVAAAGALQKAGEVVTPIVGKVLSKAEDVVVSNMRKMFPQIIKVLTGVNERTASRVIANPSIIADAKPMEVVKKEFGEFIDSTGYKYGPEAIKAVNKGRRISADKVEKLTNKTLDTIEDITKGGAKVSPQQEQELVQKALAARYSLEDLISSSKTADKRALARSYVKDQEMVDNWLETKIPGFGEKLEDYSNSKAAEAFESWLPVNKNQTPSVLRGASMGGLIATGNIPEAAFMSPRLWGIALKSAGKIQPYAGAAKEVTEKAVGKIASKSGAALTPLIERSPNDVKQDYKSGKITREQALKELRETHGFK